MPRNYLKRALKDFQYKRIYPGCQISSRSHVVGDSQLGSDVKVGSGCRIDQTIIGNRVRIEPNSQITNSSVADDVFLASACQIKDSKIAQKTLLWDRNSLKSVCIENFTYVGSDGTITNTKIGKFCSIAPGFICCPGEHPTNLLSTSPAFYLDSTTYGYRFTLSDCNYYEPYRKTTIGNDVWIGARVFVKDGITIGNGAIIAAGSVVVKDVPDYAIVGGVPAKTIRFRFSEQIIEKLLEIQWWHWDEAELKASQSLFLQEDINPFIEYAAIRSESAVS